MNQVEDVEPSTGCAMPVGMRAQFWRDYFRVNLPMQIERRSVIDCLLVELERCEREIVQARAQQARHGLLDARGESDHAETPAR
jgi:hypothetical protein